MRNIKIIQAFDSMCHLDAEGMILGVRKNVIFEEKTTTLSEGDLILLYTDGLTEAENPDGEFFGMVCTAYLKATPETVVSGMATVSIAPEAYQIHRH